MARKGKAPGGHNPLTYHEQKKLTSYGTQTARLGTDSQRKFGYCCLGLGPAKDPVATPSGHIYSREAIVEYLLQKTRDIKELKSQQAAKLSTKHKTNLEEEELQSQKKNRAFLNKDHGAVQQSKISHAQQFQTKLSKKVSTETKSEGQSTLKRTSYWLAEYIPTHDDSHDSISGTNTIPSRPSSPMSGEPLRLKDLIPLDLRTEGGGDGNDDVDARYVCGVSHKAITTQEVVCIKKSGQVILKSVYQDFIQNNSSSTAKKRNHKGGDKQNEEKSSSGMVCPITGKKFKEKDVIDLVKAASGFAASGEVQAKKYRPTLT